MNIKELRKLPRMGQNFESPVPNFGTKNLLAAPKPPAPFSPAPPNINAAVEQLAELRAREIVNEQQQSQILSRNGRTFTKFNAVDDIVDNQTEVVTAGLWSDGLASLSTHWISTAQTTSQKRYYIDSYQKETTLSGSAVQFSIAYGHAVGSGSNSFGQLNDSPSKAIYSQYKQLLLDSSDTRFITTNSGSTDSIYIINFARSRTKEKLDPGNFELPLTNITSRDGNATGSVAVGTTVYTLIDDSGNSGAPTIGNGGRVYNIVSGSINNGIYNTAAPEYYGKIYPDYGVMILDGNVLDEKLGFITGRATSIEANNHFALWHSISGSGAITNPATSDLFGFMARNAETITSTHYFVRVKNAEYNFSNNPSFITGSVGEFQQSTFIGDPKVYITTIGLYNNERELLAVAKLSKPFLKSFSRESLIRVKLDF